MPNEDPQQQSQSNNEAVKSLICSPEQSTSGDKSEQQLLSAAVEKKGANLGVDVKLAEAHTRVYDAFSRAFSRQNSQFEKAIRSLDSLNDQIVEFFCASSEEKNDDDELSKQRLVIGPSLGLMKKLLLDAQTKFRKMVEENEQLARRIDGDLQTAHEEVDVLRRDLADTNRRIAEMQANSPQPGEQNGTPSSKSNNDKNLFDQRQQLLINGTEEYDMTPKNNFQNQISFLREENERLQEKNSLLLKEVDELRYLKEAILKSEIQPTDGEEKGVDLKEKKLDPNVSHMALELTHAKEALSALKADRKRLKAEKFDLLNQMKQLYATLEDKERELREFIRTYEQRMKDSDESLRQMANERDESEREKWNILKHARDEAERAVALATQLGKKDVAVKRLEEELETVRKQMSALGYSSDADSVRTNGPSLHPVFTPTCSPLPISTPTPSVSTPTCSPLPLSNCTSTTNGRGSSADSGVRLSSDRESTASQEASSLTTAVERHPNGDSDGASICSSTATGASSSHYYYYYYGCDPGTPNKDGSSTIYANPTLLRDESRSSLSRKGDRTPSDSRNDTTNSSCTTPVNGTEDVPFGHVSQQNAANNSGGTLSRSAEELCERIAEAGDTPSKGKGVSMTLTRKSHKGGGTWGSISRVFARQKKRAPFDSSSFEGEGSDSNPGEKESSKGSPYLTKST